MARNLGNVQGVAYPPTAAMLAPLSQTNALRGGVPPVTGVPLASMELNCRGRSRLLRLEEDVLVVAEVSSFVAVNEVVSASTPTAGTAAVSCADGEAGASSTGNAAGLPSNGGNS